VLELFGLQATAQSARGITEGEEEGVGTIFFGEGGLREQIRNGDGGSGANAMSDVGDAGKCWGTLWV
jgi:hypothetical protein